MNDYYEEYRPDVLCKLNNGSIVSYDCCSVSPTSYDPNTFVCIGQGTVYSVNGVLQTSKSKMYFYVYK